MRESSEQQVTERGACFAAVNAAEGFCSFFSEIFEPEKMERIIILKGGPGTGKSTLLRRFAARARARGECVEEFLCSADPASLDAVLVPRRGIAVLDGTAPHSVDAVCPGAVETIFDLGRFWDTALLRQNRELFFGLLREKRRAYASARRILSAAGQVKQESLLLLQRAVDFEKLSAATARLLRQLLPSVDGAPSVRRQRSAFNACGLLAPALFAPPASYRVRVENAMGGAGLLLSRLLQQAQASGHGVQISSNPLDASRPDALFFPSDGVFIYAGEESEAVDKTVNFQRFVSRQSLAAVRNRLRFCERCLDTLLAQAREEFLCAKQKHAELEEHYSAAMDFDALRAQWEQTLDELF